MTEIELDFDFLEKGCVGVLLLDDSLVENLEGANKAGLLVDGQTHSSVFADPQFFNYMEI